VDSYKVSKLPKFVVRNFDYVYVKTLADAVCIFRQVSVTLTSNHRVHLDT